MSEDNDVSKIILEIINNAAPKNVESLIEKVREETNYSRPLILSQINQLINEGKIRVFSSSEIVELHGLTFSQYALSKNAAWFWITLIFVILTTLNVFLSIFDTYPFIYSKYFFGIIFVLFLPGYSFIKIVFPLDEINDIERIAYSLGMNLIFVPLMSLFFNITPWGINYFLITLSLIVFTIILTSFGLVREYMVRVRRNSLQ